MKPEHHSHWSPIVASDEFISGPEELRRRFYILFIASTVLVIALLAGLVVLCKRAITPPLVIAVSHGWVSITTPQPLTALKQETDFDHQFRETVETAFLRTEKGLLPALAEFVGEGVIEQIEARYLMVKDAHKPGYAQTLTVLESRVLDAGPRSRKICYRGILASRRVKEAQTSSVFLTAEFKLGLTTEHNSSGWRLTAMSQSTEEEFYSNEREEERLRRLQLPGARSTKDAPPPAEKRSP